MQSLLRLRHADALCWYETVRGTRLLLSVGRLAPMGAGRAGAIDRILNAGQRVIVFGLASISFGGLTYIGLCFVDMQKRKYAISQAKKQEEA